MLLYLYQEIKYYNNYRNIEYQLWLLQSNLWPPLPLSQIWSYVRFVTSSANSALGSPWSWLGIRRGHLASRAVTVRWWNRGGVCLTNWWKDVDYSRYLKLSPNAILGYKWMKFYYYLNLDGNTLFWFRPSQMGGRWETSSQTPLQIGMDSKLGCEREKEQRCINGSSIFATRRPKSFLCWDGFLLGQLR